MFNFADLKSVKVLGASIGRVSRVVEPSEFDGDGDDFDDFNVVFVEGDDDDEGEGNDDVIILRFRK